MHLPTPEDIRSWPQFTAHRPLRLLVSACLSGVLCGVDGTANGEYPWIRKLMALPNVKPVTFCPEDFAFGTPRDLPDIDGGDGFAVLEGKARVLTQHGEDCTAGMLKAAHEMLRIAVEHRIDLAVLMDMSAACGSQVISDGCRRVAARKYQQGPGVAAALLLRSGFKVVSQRDFRTLEYLYHKLDPDHPVDSAARDHHETPWYRSYFGKSDSSAG